MPEDKLNQKEIEMQIKQAISQAVGIEEKNITTASNLRTELGIDSYAAIELAYSLEDKFNVAISDNELPLLNTVGDIIELVQKKLTSKQTST